MLGKIVAAQPVDALTESNFNFLVLWYKHSALKRDLIFELSKTNCNNMFKSSCSYCGISPFNTQNPKHLPTNRVYIYTGIDQYIPRDGYRITNCVPCCKYCNNAKKKLSPTQWWAWIDKIIHFHSQDNK